MNLIAALIQSLYNVRFYRQVVQASLAKGFLYLALWSAIFSVLVSMFTLLYFFPEANRFMEWFRQEMPVIQWRPEGLQIDKASPYEMRHPRFGPIVTFDLNQSEIKSEQMGDMPIFVTSGKVYVRQSARQELRIYDLTNPELKTKEPFVLDAEKVRKLEQTFKPWLLLIIAVGTFFAFFIWKLLAALFYSLIALLINRFRRTRLGYESLLNLTFFAMTASIWIGILQIFVGGAVKMPFGFLGSLILTATYLYLAIKFTEEPSL